MSHTDCFGYKHPAEDGMDLRDYFAAKAMQGAIAAYDEGKSLNSNLIAKFAYVIADEMMRVREQ